MPLKVPVSASRGFALAQVHRPTERAGICRAVSNPAPIPSLEELFEGILNAHTVGDQRGLSLFGHTIARLAGGTR